MKLFSESAIKETKSHLMALLVALVFVTTLSTPEMLLAQNAFDCSDTGDTVTSFFENIKGLLTIASVAIVTIAVIFAGYQIAFAHKRISDVAPVLVGAFLIGAASAVAGMLVGDDPTNTTTTC